MKIDIEKLKKMISEHPEWTYEDFAKKFRCTTRAISKAVITNNIEYSHRHVHRRAMLRNEEIKEFVLAHPEMTYEEIGAKYGLSKNALGSRMKHMGIKRRPPIDERIEKTKEFALANPTMSRIDMTSKLGYPYHFVTGVLKKEFGRKQQHWIDMEDLEKTLQENPKITRKELADKYGVTIHAVSAAKARLGKPRRSGRKQPVRKTWVEIEKCIQENPNASLKEIAQKLGVCLGTIGLQVSKHNMKRGHKRKIDYESLEKEIKNGISVKDLAQKYRVRYSAIFQAAQRMGVPLQRKNAKAPSKEILVKYMEENPKETIEGIATHFGVAPQTILAAKARYGLTKSPKHIEKEQLIEEIKKNTPQADIAKKFGISQSSVSRIANEAGIRRRKKKN